jgi:hypothetical protein
MLDAVTEKQFQASVVAEAKLRGWRCWYVHDSRHSPAGWPDLTLIRGERLVFAELKRMKGKVTVEQTETLELLLGTGAEVHVWRPSDTEAITEILK